MRRWILRVGEIGHAVQSGTLEPRQWQDAMSEAYAAFPPEELVRFSFTKRHEHVVHPCSPSGVGSRNPEPHIGILETPAQPAGAIHGRLCRRVRIAMDDDHPAQTDLDFARARSSPTTYGVSRLAEAAKRESRCPRDLSAKPAVARVVSVQLVPALAHREAGDLDWGSD